MKKTILCELAFWDRFSECYPASMPFPDEKSLFLLRTWIELFCFLSRSIICLDCSVSSFNERAQNDDRLRYLWKKATEGECFVEFNESFDNLDELLGRNPFAVLMTEKGKGPIAKKYGLISLNSGNCLKKRGLFIDSGLSLRKGDNWSWDYLGGKLTDRSSNSMIIIDNYIFQNGVRDLFEILNQLLPEQCNIGYHLTIIYFVGEPDRNQLMERIREQKPYLADNLQLELIRAVGSQEFHDRVIISNNYWISIGGGFDVSKRNRNTGKLEVKRTTNMEVIYPYFGSMNVERIDSAYERILADARNELPLARSTSNNRLLIDYI